MSLEDAEDTMQDFAFYLTTVPEGNDAQRAKVFMRNQMLVIEKQRGRFSNSLLEKYNDRAESV